MTAAHLACSVVCAPLANLGFAGLGYGAALVAALLAVAFWLRPA